MSCISPVVLGSRKVPLVSAQRLRLEEILDHVQDLAIFTLDPDGLVDDWNPSLARLGGWRPEDVVGRGLDLFMPDDITDEAAAAAVLERAVRLGAAEIEGWCLRRDGARLWVNLSITAMLDVDGSVKGYAVLSRDLSERRKTEEELRLLTMTDPLTGAGNRRRGQEALKAALSQAERRELSSSVLLLDLDHFKRVNDTYGHEAGDLVLKAVVEACRSVCRDGDTVARWGGEEFVVVLPGADRKAAAAVAGRVLRAVAAMQVETGSETLRVTASIGVASADGGDVSDLVRRADAALYRAKSAGRNSLAAD